MRSIFNRFFTRRLLMPLWFALGSVIFMLLASQPSAVSANDPIFTDSGQELGATRSTSVALADFDRDGDLDLFVTNGGPDDDEGGAQPNEVWLNDGNGTFVDSGQRLGNWNSSAVALGDLDGDGDIDAFVTNANLNVLSEGEPNQVWLNDGAGHFTAGQAISDRDSMDVALGDLDGDGDLDAFVTNAGIYYHSENEIWLNNGDATFTEGQNLDYDLSSAVALADLDNDGDLDAFVTNSRLCVEQGCVGSPAQNKVYLNNGTGTFTPHQTLDESDSGDVALGDLDGDGDMDAFVVTGNLETENGRPNEVWLNDGTGTFSKTPQGLGNLMSFGVALGDLDGDGDLDAFVANYIDDVIHQSQNEVWINNGMANFTAGALLGTEYSAAVGLADVDADSDLDAVVANIGPNRVWLNHVDPFLPGQSINNLSGWNAAQGDFDGDNDLDVLLLISHLSDSRLLINDGLANFSQSNQSLPFFDHLAVGDLDGDHSLDLFGALAGNHPNQVWLNDGTGLFVDSGQSLGNSSSLFVALGDVDADGDLDAFVGNENQGNRVWLNDGTGYFSDSNQSLGSADTRALALGDMDDDGDLDAVVANLTSNQIWLNNGLGQFQAAQSFDGVPSYGIALGDFEGDGDLDVFVSNAAGGTSKVWLNDGSGHLLANKTLNSLDAHDISVGDLDGDGDLDVVMAIREQPDTVLLNDGLLNFEHTQLLGDDSISRIPLLGDFNGDGALDAFMVSNFANKLYLNKAGDATRLQVEVQKPGATQDANLYSTAEIIAQNIIPITYTLYHPLSATIGWVEGFYSFDGGDNWHQAVATSDTVLTNLTTAAHPSSTPTNTHLFKWDTFASGFFGQSDNVVFRIVAYSPHQGKEISGTYYYTNTLAAPHLWPSAASTTYPFRVRGTQIRVLSDTQPVEGAQIYRLPNGAVDHAQLMINDAAEPFLTNPQGYLIGRGALQLGDQLVAMVPISRTEHYTFYHTSATPTVTGLDMYTVDAPGVQSLSISEDNPLLLFDLDVSLEWDARSNDGEESEFLIILPSTLERASEILYDLTNGQAALGKVRIHQAQEAWAESDVVIYSRNNFRPNADMGGIVDVATSETFSNSLLIPDAYQPGQLRMSAVWNRDGNPTNRELGEDWAPTLAHELAHYLLFLPDNYLGISDSGSLIQTNCPGSFMTDAYQDGYTEFLRPDEWIEDCLRTLAQHTTGRTDWETITTFYQMLNGTIPNSGPNNLPLDLAHITLVESLSPPKTLSVPIFYLKDENDSPISSGDVRGYLFKNKETADLTDDLVLVAGARVGEVLEVRGAEVGDRLCVFDYSHSPRRLGCIEELTLGSSSPSITLHETLGWEPKITVGAINSRTLTISVTQPITESFGELYAQFLPLSPPTDSVEIPSPVVSLTRTGEDTFAQTIILEEPTSGGFIRLWLSDTLQSDLPLWEEITEFTLSGGWGPGGSGQDVGAPIASSDGQAIVLDLDQTLGGSFAYALQSLSSPPNLPPWLTPVGQAYRFSAGQDIIGSLYLMMGYAQRDVPGSNEGEERLGIYYSPDEGENWQRLSTELETSHNHASAAMPGEGIYALISTIEMPPLQSGWNPLGYPIVESRPVRNALASIDGYYTSVYHYDLFQSRWKLYDWIVATEYSEWDEFVNELTTLDFGRTYSIYATEAITIYYGVGNLTTLNPLNNFSPPIATFYGNVTATLDFTPTIGMAVTAHINGVLCGETILEEWNGELAYKIQVSNQGDCDEGVVTFQVDNQVMAGEVPWDNSQAWFHSLPSAEEKALLNACVTLQGRPSPPDSRLSVLLHVTLTVVGESSPTYSFSPTTDEQGCFSLTEIEVGSYDIRVKKSSSLQNIQHISLVGGENNIDLGTLREGDANNDNVITILDFSILAATFGKCEGEAGYDQRADFNGDTCITILDFSLLASNFGQAGAEAPTIPSRITHSSTQDVALIIEPAVTTVARGELFTVSVQIQAGNQLVDGAQIRLHFDPAMLEVQQVMTGEGDQALSLPLMNRFNNKAGTIEVAAGTLDDYPKGEIELAQIQFKALTPTDSTPLSLIKEESNVTFGGLSLLGEQADALITISEPTSISLMTTSSSPHKPNPLLAVIALAIVVAGFVVRRTLR